MGGEGEDDEGLFAVEEGVNQAEGRGRVAIKIFPWRVEFGRIGNGVGGEKLEGTFQPGMPFWGNG